VSLNVTLKLLEVLVSEDFDAGLLNIPPLNIPPLQLNAFFLFLKEKQACILI
jgi:hypothetical protein